MINVEKQRDWDEVERMEVGDYEGYFGKSSC